MLTQILSGRSFACGKQLGASAIQDDSTFRYYGETAHIQGVVLQVSTQSMGDLPGPPPPYQSSGYKFVSLAPQGYQNTVTSLSLLATSSQINRCQRRKEATNAELSSLDFLTLPDLNTLTLNGLIKTPMPSRYLRIFYSCFIVILSRMIGPNYLFYHY